MILVTGSLFDYMKNNALRDEKLVYFVPTATGNCRFSQYNIFLNHLIKKNCLRNVALLTLTSENGYAGIGTKNTLNVLKSIITADVMDNIRNSLKVLAGNKPEAEEIFNDQWNMILETIESGDFKNLYQTLDQVAETLSKIPLKQTLADSKMVSILGEIFVRKNEFACQNLFELLADNDIIAHVASTTEWLHYVDHLVKEKILESDFSLLDNLKFHMKLKLQVKFEKEIKEILAKSKLCHNDLIDIKKLIEYGQNFVDIKLTGEPIIVIGAYFKEILESVHGVISIGPFACLPTRVTESILNNEATLENKVNITGETHLLNNYKGLSRLPFLSIESDGNPFPSIIESRIEAFCLQVERVHKRQVMLKTSSKELSTY